MYLISIWLSIILSFYKYMHSYNLRSIIIITVNNQQALPNSIYRERNPTMIMSEISMSKSGVLQLKVSMSF